MKEPQRLIDGDATDLERRLLGSWDAEQPSDRARAAALGLVAAGAAIGGSSAAAAATAGAAATPKGATIAGAYALGKWIAIGVIGGIASVGSFEIASSREAAVLEQPAARSSALAVAPRAIDRGTAALADDAPAPTAQVAAPPPAPTAPLAAPAASALVAPSHASARSVASNEALATPSMETAPAPRRTLTEEIKSIDAARAALAAGDAARALALIEQHDREFASGELAQEALLHRIEALVKLGRRSEAVALARSFVRAHPSSTYVDQIIALVPEIDRR